MILLLICAALAAGEDDTEAAWGGAAPRDDGEEDTGDPGDPPSGGWSSEPPPAQPPPAEAPPPVDAPPVDPPPAEPPAEAPPDATDPADIIGAAIEAPPVNSEQLDWLKPRLGELPPNPRAHTDFSAYTLEWGEVSLALSNARVGVLPRTQVGTSVPLDVLGLYNVNAKVNPLRLGPWDLALSAAHYRLIQPDFFSGYTALGVMNSLTLHEKISVHLGADWWTVHMEGVPDLQAIHPALQLNAADVGRAIDPIDYGIRALTLRVASDLRFNRRDSLILQLDGAVWTRSMSQEIPDLPPLEAMVTLASLDGWIAPTHVYSASLAYQMDLRRLSVRLGGGVSSTPGAWLLRSVEVAYRFGGPTLGDERRQRTTWRRNRRERDAQP